MNFTTVPTLRKMILLKLAARVCNQTEIKSLIEQPTTLAVKCSSSMIEEIISTLKLPNCLHLSLVSVMKPVIIEIKSWILYLRHVHSEVQQHLKTRCPCLLDTDLQANLHWQTVGILDKRLTTLELIEDGGLDSAFRFVLACSCCSETKILDLWRNLSTDVREHIPGFYFLPIVSYWTDRLGKAAQHDFQFIPDSSFPYVFRFDYSFLYLHAMESFYKKLPIEEQHYLFGTYGGDLDDLQVKIRAEKDSQEYKNRVAVGLVNVDNVAALRYFLRKFERIKKRKLLEVVARNHFISSELLVFCLSQMSCDQVTELLRSGHGSRVLSCFVNSPWQENLRDFINSYEADLTKVDFAEVCTYLINFKIGGGWKDYDYAPDVEYLYIRYKRLPDPSKTER